VVWRRPSRIYHGGVTRRTALVVALAVVLAAAGVALGAVALHRGDGREAATTASDPAVCERLDPREARPCYISAFSAQLQGEDDPRVAVQQITARAWETGGFLLPNCHGIMHTVAREYARAQGVTLATLMDYLPQTDDPGCPAGFAHGLVTAVAPEMEAAEPRNSAAVCAQARTRYQRYSCTHGFGHAFMRMHGGDLGPALDMCRALGPNVAPDCAQGAFHDYWFAVIGVDDAKLANEAVTSPRELCAAQSAEFVRPCWYRAFVDSRPEGSEVSSRSDFEELCSGLAGLQRQACITAASVIGPLDPEVQIGLCAELPAADVESCIRGTKVQNLLGATVAEYVELARTCDLFVGPTRAGCYRWLGKTISVVTDGAFGARGCPELRDPRARRACAAGARRVDDALVTFS
jgi:hypothetical protein